MAVGVLWAQSLFLRSLVMAADFRADEDVRWSVYCA